VSSVTGREHPTICSVVHKPNTIAMDIAHYGIEQGINGIEIFRFQDLRLERWKSWDEVDGRSNETGEYNPNLKANFADQRDGGHLQE
jgi:hypothetical protein